MRDHPDPGQIHKLEVFRSILILADYVPNTQGTSARSGIVLLWILSLLFSLNGNAVAWAALLFMTPSSFQRSH